jgi:hypothetical protein
MFTFGRISKSQSREKFDLGVSDDKRALTITFSNFQTTIKGSKSSAAMLTRLFTLLLPVKGGGERLEIEFTIQGFVLTMDGATASLVCSVNGQTTVADFSEKSDESVLQKLKFTAETPSDARLCVFLLLGRDKRNANADGHLSVTTIDAEILPRPS